MCAAPVKIWRRQAAEPGRAEHGGPPVAPPQRKGFGSEMIRRGFVRDVGGEASLDFDPAGVRFHLTAPLSLKIMAERLAAE